jgi:hypothetical protein
MRIFTIVMTAMFIVHWPSVSEAGNEPSQELTPGKGDKRMPRSEGVSLGDGDYVVAARESGELFLEHHSRIQKSEWKLKPTLHQSSNLALRGDWATETKEGKIDEITLSRWSRNRLMAVVKVGHGNEATFWCLTFSNAKLLLENRDDAPPFVTFAAVLAKGSRENRIMALSGTRDAGSITAVVGRSSESGSGSIDEGIMILNVCPYPAAVDGRVGRFKVTYAPDPVFDDSK